jgi:iron-sulfur cluster assembly accessory protein
MSEEVKIYKPSATAEIQATAKAIAHFKKHMARHADCHGVRLSVAPSGCSGLKYVLDYVTDINTEDHKIVIDDVDFYVDDNSVAFLQGTTLDYVKEGINERIVFLNPNETGGCGCGESFTVD